jgi:HPt (histidine-containing phosphotransfer) domain-containing protein
MSYIDTEVLASLREILEDSFTELVDTFIQDGERRLQLIHDALKAGDLKIVSDEAHGLKGSCQNIGAMPLADVSAKVETQSRDGEAAGLEQDVSSMQQLFAATSEQLRAF